MTLNLDSLPLSRMVGEVARARAVLPYMLTVWEDHVEQQDSNAVADTFLRALNWMMTLVRLDRATDFQAGMAATRAFLEMAVDLTLINAHPGRYPLEMLSAWEESALLKQCRLMEERSKNKKLTPYVLEDHYRDVITNHSARIVAARQKHWNGTEHPMRWTGSRSLDNDVKIASQIAGAEDLNELYLRIYSTLNWCIHGSGAVGFGSVPSDDFAAFMWMALENASVLAMRVTRLTLVHFNRFDPGVERAFVEAQAEHERQAASATTAYLEDPSKGPEPAPRGTWPWARVIPSA